MRRLIPKILYVSPSVPETEIWGLSSSGKPARSSSRLLGMLLLTSVFSSAPGCLSVLSVHLRGWLSGSCGSWCLSPSSPRIPQNQSEQSVSLLEGELPVWPWARDLSAGWASFSARLTGSLVESWPGAWGRWLARGSSAFLK